jgi:hypothetical protein
MPFADRYSVDHGHVEVGLSSTFNALLVDNRLKLELRHATTIHFRIEVV